MKDQSESNGHESSASPQQGPGHVGRRWRVLRRHGLGVGVGLIVPVVGLGVAVYFGRTWFMKDSGRRAMENILLKTPVIGPLASQIAMARFCRMLGTLVGAGVSLVASLKVAREAIGNQTLSDTVSSAIEQVQRGQPLSKALGESARLFPVT